MDSTLVVKAPHMEAEHMEHKAIDNSVDAQFLTITQKINAFKTQITELQKYMTLLEKTIKKENKSKMVPLAPLPVLATPAPAPVLATPVLALATPAPAAPVPKTSKAKKSGSFDIPEYMSKDLCEFLQVPVPVVVAENSEPPPRQQMSRSEATKRILNYIQQQHLQNKDDRVNILPDEKLIKLFNLNTASDKLTYFNIHKHIHYHFTT
jgi:hypothetical protein